MKRILFSLFLLCSLVMYGQAQKTITGTVIDDQNVPLPGVNVVPKSNPSQGTITDIDGKYSLEVSESETLQFSFIGMQSQEFSVAGQSIINVTMLPDYIGLDEVVAVGYGVQKKSDITGAVASVKAEELEKMSTATVMQAMQGKVAGVNITSDTGSPGSPMTVTIRGRGTVGNSDPLYVVDGLPVSSIGFLNSKDIESMEVLKDASATAIYGSRGANGVILITTKRAKEGALSVEVDAYRGVQTAWKEPDLLNSEEWYDVINIANFNGGNDELVLRPGADDLTHTTNWWDEITRSAVIEDYNVKVSGGTEKVKAFVSGNYFNQDGLIEGSGYKRYSMRVNTEMQVSDKLKIGQNLSISESTRKVINEGDYFNGIVNSALKLDPITPVRGEDGEFMSSPYTDVKNPVAQIANTHNKRRELRIAGNAYLDYKIINDLVFRTSYGMDINVVDRFNFNPTYNYAADEQNLVNSVFRRNDRTLTWNWTNTLTYMKEIEKHSFSIMAGLDAQESEWEWFSASKNNIPSDESYLRYLRAATGDENGMASADGLLQSEWAMFSYLGRLTYSYDNKYLFTGNVRRDGSSKFGPEKRWGTFPSAAVKWKLSNEGFMQSLVTGGFLTRVEIRGGWGQIGNDKIDLYQYEDPTVSMNQQYGYVFGKDNADQLLHYGGTIEGVGNKKIHWEVTESTNVGLDLGFFNNKLTATFDYFVKDTKDMLLRAPIPNFIGYTTSPYSNVGDVQNKGFEFVLGHKNQVGQFKYNVDFNIASIKNEVVNLGGKDFIAAGYVRIDNSTRTQVGHEIGAFYGYVTDGLFQNWDEVNAHADAEGNLMQGDAIPGDIRFKDINGYDENGDLTGQPDGKLDDADRTFIGSPHPDFTFGMNINMEYRNFDLSMFWQGVVGNDIYNFMIFETMNPGKTTNKYRDILGSWSGEGTSNDIPILNGADANDNFRVSDRYLEDGSYLRLRNIQLGYTLPQTFTEKAGIERCRVYVSGQNLLTFTKYSGLEPEIGYYDQYSSGIDEGIFPHARTVSLGLNLTF
ncbi:SusC/RagA family TonB-linked outer membrane protein [Carboxylicivirga sp. RSCT41]|uniref:SusC/RagA family TonB-linked outer membrane protein n=1 Tax=Carboxylicivirga agarovorans TaxID=3417570 RepID=UPI003D328C18